MEIFAGVNAAILHPVCVTHNDNGTINGQLPTGNMDYPFVPISDSLVSQQDVLDILEDTTSPSREYQGIDGLANLQSIGISTLGGIFDSFDEGEQYIAPVLLSAF